MVFYYTIFYRKRKEFSFILSHKYNRTDVLKILIDKKKRLKNYA